MRACSTAPFAFKWVLAKNTVVDPKSNMVLLHAEALGAERHHAYLLPWWNDCVIWMRPARLPYFTDTMNGCTLAIGGDPQSPVVAHSNCGRGTGAAVWQLCSVRKALPTIENWQIFSKPDYISGAELTGLQVEGHEPDRTQVTVVGVYQGADEGWEFLAQSWMRYRKPGASFPTDFEVRQICPPAPFGL